MPLLQTALLPSAAVRDRLGSSAAVGRTHRLDGRTSVLAVRDGAGWRRIRPVRWTPSTVEHLRADRILEVLLRRGWRRSRLPLAWLPRAGGG